MVWRVGSAALMTEGKLPSRIFLIYGNNRAVTGTVLTSDTWSWLRTVASPVAHSRQHAVNCLTPSQPGLIRENGPPGKHHDEVVFRHDDRHLASEARSGPGELWSFSPYGSSHHLNPYPAPPGDTVTCGITDALTANSLASADASR